MVQYLDPNLDDPFPNAFQRQFKRSIAIPGEPRNGGGGGPMPIPEGGPGNWRRPNENQGGGGGPMPIPDPVEGFPGGGGGPMPIPDGGPNWKNLPPAGTGGFHPGGQFLGEGGGGGGGPMPMPDPWTLPGANPEDYGVSMEFGGPGAVNPIGPNGMVMNPAQLQKFYAPPAPQAPAGPGRINAFGAQAPQPFANNAPQRQRPQFQGNDRAAQPQQVVDGTGQRFNQMAPLRRDQKPPPPAANPQGNPAQPANTGGFNFQQTFKKPAGNWDWSNLGNILNRRY